MHTNTQEILPVHQRVRRLNNSLSLCFSPPPLTQEASNTKLNHYTELNDYRQSYWAGLNSQKSD